MARTLCSQRATTIASGSRSADELDRNATRRFVPGGTDSLWSGKFAKAITGPDASPQGVLGHELEIVPLADPIKVKPEYRSGSKCCVRSKPLPGAEVERGDGVMAMPEKDIPAVYNRRRWRCHDPDRANGQHLIVIDHKVTPSATPDQAGTDMFVATLWFVR